MGKVKDIVNSIEGIRAETDFLIANLAAICNEDNQMATYFLQELSSIESTMNSMLDYLHNKK